MNFGPEYADVYDALYQGKDYVAEANFVSGRLRGLLPEEDSHLLDLGCGTGLHAIELARQGCFVTGIDRSEAMIARAENRRRSLPEDIAQRLQFEVGDMCELDRKVTADGVLSLFHVICYMTDDGMLRAALRAARRHLKRGGVFLFDFWYADALLREPPARRERTIDSAGQRIHQITTPRWEPERSLVHIVYDVCVTNRETGKVSRKNEVHTIRYFTTAELQVHLEQSGFSVLRFGEWLTKSEPSERSFGVYCLAAAV